MKVYSKEATLRQIEKLGSMLEDKEKGEEKGASRRRRRKRGKDACAALLTEPVVNESLKGKEDGVMVETKDKDGEKRQGTIEDERERNSSGQREKAKVYTVPMSGLSLSEHVENQNAMHAERKGIADTLPRQKEAAVVKEVVAGGEGGRAEGENDESRIMIRNKLLQESDGQISVRAMDDSKRKTVSIMGSTQSSRSTPSRPSIVTNVGVVKVRGLFRKKTNQSYFMI